MQTFRSIAFAAALFVGGAIALIAAARAEVPSPSVIARTSPAGNYLAGRHATVSRDADAAMAYYRAALRADPKNEELLERTFLTMLASGAIEEAAPLAERLIVIEKSHRMARLTLAARAIKRNQYASARSHLSQSVRGPIADLTATLVGAWAQYGANDFQGRHRSHRPAAGAGLVRDVQGSPCRPNARRVGPAPRGRRTPAEGL